MRAKRMQRAVAFLGGSSARLQTTCLGVRRALGRRVGDVVLCVGSGQEEHVFPSACSSSSFSSFCAIRVCHAWNNLPTPHPRPKEMICCFFPAVS